MRAFIILSAVCVCFAHTTFWGSKSSSALENGGEEADVVADFGEPIPGLPAGDLFRFNRGLETFTRHFARKDGLGPHFNATSCVACHGVPAAGGSSPRYRDVLLVGNLNQNGAVAKLYPDCTQENALEQDTQLCLPSLVLPNYGPRGTIEAPVSASVEHPPIPPDAGVVARRNPPPTFGVGLFRLVSDAEILSRADPEDLDGDGISGRVNRVPSEDDAIGRLGYKSQTASVEAFTRGALHNQMGITSNSTELVFGDAVAPGRAESFLDSLLKLRTAHAQVAEPKDSVVDYDDIRDPEIARFELLDLVFFQENLAAPRRDPISAAAVRGETVFNDIGCAACHTASIKTSLGLIHPYSDLLLHDMGPELADGITMHDATGSEFRTQPLWGLCEHRPFLHDGRADSIEQAILLHGGEGQAARDNYSGLGTNARQDLHRFLESLCGREQPTEGNHFLRGDSNNDGGVDVSDAVFTLNFLFLGGLRPACMAAADTNDDGDVILTDAVYTINFLFLGGEILAEPFPGIGPDPTLDLGCREPGLPPVPSVGSPGGPDRELTNEEKLSWRRGRQFFSTPATMAQGLGPLFNGDSCASCHVDPAIGGAGGLDIDVVRYAHVDAEGVVTQLPGGPAVSRHSIPLVPRDECDPETNVIELRQTPSALGLGLVDRIPDATILANADPDDLDKDGISGRARMAGKRVGRFGHKAGVPTLNDFTADAIFNEVGLTIDPALSSFAVAVDTDEVADPEATTEQFTDLVFFVSHLAPPQRELPEEPAALQRVLDGEQIFASTGCTGCHLPSLEGVDGPVAAYSDFLLHDVADPATYNVGEAGAEPREFRTAPLWGFRDTGPHLHDGSAETFSDALLKGHYGEASTAREAYQSLPPDDRLKLEEFVRSL